MKIRMLVTAGVLATAVFGTPAVFAKMGPGFGLPGNWVPAAGRGLGPLPALQGNSLSAMCVECHTANPSASIASGVLPFAELENRYRGSHFIRNRFGAVDHPTVRTTLEKLDAWAGSGRFSRYGNFATGQSVTATAGDMICESCHNIVRNTVNSVSRNHLLLDAYDASTGVATLCQGCHIGLTGTAHHPMGAVNNTDRAGVRNPPTATANTDFVRYFTTPNVVTCISCHKVHRAQTATGARILRRGASRVAGIPGVLNRPVNVSYYAGKPPTYLGAVVSYVVGDQANFDLNTGSADPNPAGLLRSSDFPVSERAVYSADPLCDSCHKYDD